MSVQATSWVWRNSKAQLHSTRWVLMAIAEHANPQGYAWPSLATLSEYCRMSVATVQRSIKALVELGELQVTHQAGGAANLRADRRPNLYRVQVVDIPKRQRADNPADGVAQLCDAVDPDGVAQPCDPDESTGSHTEHDGVASETSRGRIAVHTEPKGTNYEPSSSQFEREGYVGNARNPNSPPNCSWHKNHPDPPPCGRCGQERRKWEIEQAAADLAGIASAARRPDWCTECDKTTRQIDDQETGLPRRCPNCHPSRAAPRPSTGTWATSFEPSAVDGVWSVANVVPITGRSRS